MREVLGKNVKPEDLTPSTLSLSEPWEKQEAILRSLVEPAARTTIVSCNGAGKSYTDAWAAHWFLNTRRNAKVVVILPNNGQVKRFFRYMAECHQTSKHKLGGEMYSKQYRFGPEWYAEGIATDKEEKFQGPHQAEGGLLSIIDEASGVRDYVYSAVYGYSTGTDCRILLSGNGNQPTGMFYKSHGLDDASRWKRFQISAFDVPRHIIPMSWIEEMRETYGEESPQWIVRVMGGFPTKGADYQLVSLSTLEGALESDIPTNGDLHIGLDVARGGHDNNVAVLTQNGVVCDIRVWHSSDTTRTSEVICELSKQWGVEEHNVHIEQDGIGGAVVDRCREAGFHFDAVQSGGSPIGDWKELTGVAQFFNRKAELAWAGRLALMQGKAKIPREFSQVWNDVQRINYEITNKGLLALESKRKLVSRSGRSPDFADAWFVSLSRVGAVPRLVFI